MNPKRWWVVFAFGLSVGGACGGARRPPSADPIAGGALPVSTGTARPLCDKNLRTELVGTTVWKLPGDVGIGFKTGMTIDANGAPRAYHADDTKALDLLANAGSDGAWMALATDNGKPTGRPLVQGAADPAPGYFISTTALFDKAKPVRSPARYVDASKVSYVALPPEAKEWGLELGDLAVVMNAKNGRIAFAILADIGAPAKLGAGSIALADAVGIASNPKDGGLRNGVVYAIFARSGTGKPRSAADIDREGQRLFDAFGGRPMLATCFH